MYFLCPVRRHRKLINQSIIKLKKSKKRKFFDTRSISANTEFDFDGVNNNEDEEQQVQTPIRPHPSILKLDPKHTPSPTVENTGGGQTFSRMNSNKSGTMESSVGFLMDRKDEKQLESMAGSKNRKYGDFGTLPSKLSSSRGQLKDRRPSVVTFDLDSKRKENKYNTIASTEVQLLSKFC